MGSKPACGSADPGCIFARCKPQSSAHVPAAKRQHLELSTAQSAARAHHRKKWLTGTAALSLAIANFSTSPAPGVRGWEVGIFRICLRPPYIAAILALVNRAFFGRNWDDHRAIRILRRRSIVGAPRRENILPTLSLDWALSAWLRQARSYGHCCASNSASQFFRAEAVFHSGPSTFLTSCAALLRATAAAQY